MGWTFTDKGSQSTKEYFEKSFNYDKPEEGKSGKIIRFSATWTTAYMAYEIMTKGNREVIALVCLIRHVPKASDGYTFGYKDMDETMGPCECKCPKTILELLTPTNSQYAKEWREKCWARINKRKANPKVTPGTWIEFKDKISFRGGSEHSKLCLRRGNTFSDGYNLFSIPNWRDREFKVIGKSWYYQFKGIMEGRDGKDVPVELSGRFVHLNPTVKDARAAARENYERVTEIHSITFSPLMS